MINLRTYEMDDNWKTKLDKKGNPIKEDRDYSTDDLLKIAASAHGMFRLPFGWDLYFTEGGVNKTIFIRGGADWNRKTRAKQPVEDWIRNLEVEE